MNILVVPTTDWLRHPVPSRHHFIFERLAKKHNIYILHFNIFRNKPVRRELADNMYLIRPQTIKSKKLLGFYAINAPLHTYSIFKSIKEYNIDTIFNAHILHGTASFFASNLNKSLRVFDFSDFFPESASIYYADSTWILKKIVEDITWNITKFNIKLANLCLAPTLPLVNILRKFKNNVHLLTNGVDTSIFSPRKENQDLKEELGLSDNIIGFVGSVEAWLDLMTVMKGLKKLKKEIPDVQLLFIGSAIKTTYFQKIRQVVRRENLTQNFIETGTLPYEHLPEYISLMKCCIIPFRTDLYISKVALPNKFFEYAACGKPVITTALPEIKRVAGDLVFFYKGSDEFANQVKKVLREEQINSLLSRKMEDLVKQYDWNLISARMEKLIKEQHLGKLSK